MNKRNILSIAVLVILAASYIYFFTDWWRPREIKIFHTVARREFRNARRAKTADPETQTMLFGLNGAYRLTEIKVVPLDEWKTNPATLPLWHLISDSNSAPVKLFQYGQRIRGMKPAVSGEWARPLETNVTYRLFVVARSAKGQHDFVALPKPTGK